MKIFNTLTGRSEDFEPIEKGSVRMYACGPTVYDVGHLGHGRAAVTFDLIRRYLIYKGFRVKFVSNYTDIDDKMINRANERGISVAELAAEMIPKYERDFAALGVLPPDEKPRATEYIEPIVEILQMLEKNGFTYMISDGLYFDVSKFAKYGELSGQDLEKLHMGARVEVNLEKKSPFDFVLWKKEKSGEPAWDSPFGSGRPGWHIECSAMSWKTLNVPFDIHGGGQDLIFPHHECEVAQSEGAFQKPFVKYWMHNGFVNINEEKMSKSLGNFLTLEDILKQFSGKTVRLFYLQTHYRAPIDFTPQLLKQAEESLTRLHDFMRRLHRENAKTNAHAELSKLLERTKTDFESALDDDFNTSEALAAIFDCVKTLNKWMDEKSLSQKDCDAIEALFQKFDTVLHIIMPDEAVLPDEDLALIVERDQARTKKDFAKADELRKKLEWKGIILEDTSHGTVWKKS